jgi:hypothetical protein
MYFRRERFSDYGFRARDISKSISLGVLFTVLYDIAISLHAGAWLWVPLARHRVLRAAFAGSLPVGLFGVLIVIVIWGFFESFFGVYFSRKVNECVGHKGIGWLAPGVLAFALFNEVLHAAIGQGISGFVTSFASGYGIAVIPAVTRNA